MCDEAIFAKEGKLIISRASRSSGRDPLSDYVLTGSFGSDGDLTRSTDPRKSAYSGVKAGTLGQMCTGHPRTDVHEAPRDRCA